MTNLTTPPLADATKEAVERLAFYGHNAFTDPSGKQQARSILSDLAGHNRLDIDVLVGALLAAEVPARGTTNLKRMADRLS